MAGGTGSRLWPLSRELYPKQFIPVKGDYTMLQSTIKRLDGLDCSNPIVLEPVGRNTAPAVALAALAAKKNNAESNPLLLVLAADHIFEKEEVFREAIRQAIPCAKQGKLVTFGIVPDRAETGYGYIMRGDSISQKGCNEAYKVSKFVEKPDLDTAKSYVDSGEYYWNSGMFLFQVDSYLAELKKFRPDILEACENAMNAINPDLDFTRVDEKSLSG